PSFVAHGGGQAYTLSGNTLPGGVYFNLTNNGAEPLSVTGFGLRLGDPAFGVVTPPRNWEVYATNGPGYQGVEFNAGAWTNVGPAVSTVHPPYFATGTGPLAEIDLTSDVMIGPGESKGFHIFSNQACVVFNWNFG